MTSTSRPKIEWEVLDAHSGYVGVLPTGAVVLLDRPFLLPGFRKGTVPRVFQVPVIVGSCEWDCPWRKMSWCG